jgi:hypothetical protein
MPDRRTRQGTRDLALLHLLGAVGLGRSEAAALLVGDVDERRRAGDPRLRQAIAGSTSWWVTVRHAKRGPHARRPARRRRARGDHRLGAVRGNGRGNKPARSPRPSRWSARTNSQFLL